jgi:hypothetical protein
MVVGAFWVMQGKETGFSPTCLCEVSGSLRIERFKGRVERLER